MPDKKKLLPIKPETGLMYKPGFGWTPEPLPLELTQSEMDKIAEQLKKALAAEVMVKTLDNPPMKLLPGQKHWEPPKNWAWEYLQGWQEKVTATAKEVGDKIPVYNIKANPSIVIYDEAANLPEEGYFVGYGSTYNAAKAQEEAMATQNTWYDKTAKAMQGEKTVPHYNLGTESDPRDTFDIWALVEVLGHRQYAGKVTSYPTVVGTFLRIEVAESDLFKGFTKLINPTSVFSITPCSQELAEQIAYGLNAKPFNIVEIDRRVVKQTGRHLENLDKEDY